MPDEMDPAEPSIDTVEFDVVRTAFYDVSPGFRDRNFAETKLRRIRTESTSSTKRSSSTTSSVSTSVLILRLFWDGREVNSTLEGQ